MSRLAVWGLMVILLAGLGHAQTIITVVGACSATTMAHLLNSIHEELPGTWDIYLICSKAQWETLMRHIDRPLTTVALTSASQPTTWVNAERFEALSPIEQRWALRHELAHVKCKCALGESRFRSSD